MTSTAFFLLKAIALLCFTLSLLVLGSGCDGVGNSEVQVGQTQDQDNNQVITQPDAECKTTCRIINDLVEVLRECKGAATVVAVGELSDVPTLCRSTPEEEAAE